MDFELCWSCAGVRSSCLAVSESGRERGVVRSRGYAVQYAWLRQKVRRSRDMTLAGWVQFAKQGVKVAKALLGQSKSGWRPKGGSYRLPPNQQIPNIHQASKQTASKQRQMSAAARAARSSTRSSPQQSTGQAQRAQVEATQSPISMAIKFQVPTNPP